MEKYNVETINNIRKIILNGEYGLATKIKDLEVWFWGESPEEVSDEMIAFALDIVDTYLNNKEKYDGEAIETVKDYLSENENVDDLTILDQLGKPIISVATEEAASLMYGSVKEIGDHMPEVELDRNLEICDVAING